MTRFILAAALAVIASVAPAHAEPVDGGRAVVELISEVDRAGPGDTVMLGLKMDLDEGWHVYWRNAGDAGLPPEIYWDDASDIPAGAISEFLWPVPDLLPVVEGEIMDYGYDHQVIFPFRVTIPETTNSSVTLKGLADYLICEDVCVPESAQVELMLEVGERRANETHGRLIADWAAKVPADFSGQARLDTSGEVLKLSLLDEEGVLGEGPLRFFPYQHEIIHASDQPQSKGAKGLTLDLTPSGDEIGEHLEGIIVTASGKGYAISADMGAPFAQTFGSAPVAPASAVKTRSLLVLALLALLGGLILNLMPCVLPVLTIKAMGMVGAAASGQTRELKVQGLWYTIGVLVSFAALAAIIVAIRAATGTATLGFQLQHAPTVAILTLIMFVIGLWLLGMFELGGSVQNVGSDLAAKGGSTGAFFTGVLAAVVGAPCVGPFLGVALGAVMSQPAPAVFAVFLAMGLGLALPFLLLSFVPGLHRLLPKPGAWMETLKQVFAFPMFLTAAWLLSVLGALAGYHVVAWTAAGATLIAFGIWMLRKGGGPARVLAIIALVAGLAYPAWRANAPAPVAGKSTAYSAKYETESWSPQRVAELISEGRPIFVDFTAVWCATCQLNKSTSIKTKRVQEAFREANVAFLVADFTRKDPVIAEELKRRERPGVPMYLWYAPGESEPVILPEVLTPALLIGLVQDK